MNKETREKRQNIYAWIIFIQALIATLGSLYYGFFGDPIANLKNGTYFLTVNGFNPCTLCVYARILMYPLVIISLVGILTKDRKFTNYIIPFTLIGIPLEIYHYMLQRLPIENIFDCTKVNPCSAFYVQYFGFISIPFLCLTAFIVILIFSLLNRKLNQ